MTSAVYRQASGRTGQPGQAVADALKVDPANRLLWHMPLRRLEAEIVRDAEGPVNEGQPAHPESFGVYCLVQGYKAAIPDDERRMEILPLQFAALYEWCRKVVAGDIVPDLQLAMALNYLAKGKQTRKAN